MRPYVACILASAFFLALYDLAKKASVRGNAVLPVLIGSTTAGSLAFAGYLVGVGRLGAAWAALDLRVIALGLAKSAIVGTSWIFTFKALKTLPITIATPIRASAPALVIGAAVFVYGEVPTRVQALGMGTVLAGYWAFSWAGRHEGIDFLHDRAVWCATLGAVFSAVSALWDKYVFQIAAAPLEATQLVFQVGLCLVYVTVFAFERGCLRVRPPFEWRWTIPLVGVLLAVADYLMFTALAMPATPVSVLSLMRRLSVVITFVLGAVSFRETNLRRKGLALVLVIAGIVLLGWKG